MKQAILIFSFLALLAAGCNSKSATVTEEKVVPVKTALIERKNIQNEVSFTGRLQAKEEQLISAPLQATVQTIFVKEGDRVERNTPLLKLDNQTAQNAVKQAEQQYETAQNAYGDALKQQQQTSASAKAELEEANQNIKASQQNLNSLQKQEDELTQKLEEARENDDSEAVSELEVELQTIMSQIAVETITLRNYENTAAQQELIWQQSQNSGVIPLYETALQQAEANLTSSRELLKNATITSPISGQVVSLTVKKGDTLLPQTPIIQIAAMNSLKIPISVIAKQAQWFEEGASYKVEIPAYSSTTTGVVVSKTLIPNVQGFHEIEIAVDNNDKLFEANAVAKVWVSVTEAAAELVIPSDAVVNKGGKSFVYTTDGSSAKRIEVEVLYAGKTETAVQGDIQEGDTVIVSGQNIVQEGSLIKVIQAGETE